MPVAANLRIDKDLARECYASAFELAVSDAVLPAAWTEKTERISNASSKSFTPMFGTALLAKATNRQVDARALQVKGVHRGYSARSLAKDVFVPCCERAGIDIRTTGAEPLNNQPFFGSPRVERTLKVKPNAQGDLDFLCEALEEADFLEGRDAIEALAAFLRERIRLSGVIQPVSLGPGVLELYELVTVLDEFVSTWSEGGKIGQALVAAILDVAYDDVRTERINDPSAKWPGDVGVFVDGALWTAIEVKQRHFTDTEVLQFARRLAESGVDRGVVVELGQTPSSLDFQTVSRLAYDQRRVDIEFVFSPGDFLLDCVRRSTKPIPAIMASFQQLGMTRLEEIEASDEARAAWVQLFR